MLADGWGGLSPSEFITEKLSVSPTLAPVATKAAEVAKVVKSVPNYWWWIIPIVAVLGLAIYFYKRNK
jgi:hypothetical protein